MYFFFFLLKGIHKWEWGCNFLLGSVVVLIYRRDIVQLQTMMKCAVRQICRTKYILWWVVIFYVAHKHHSYWMGIDIIRVYMMGLVGMYCIYKGFIFIIFGHIFLLHFYIFSRFENLEIMQSNGFKDFLRNVLTHAKWKELWWVLWFLYWLKEEWELRGFTHYGVRVHIWGIYRGFKG